MNEELLARVPLFAVFSPEERSELLRGVEVVRLQSGSIVFEIGDPGGSMYVVESGQVELFLKDTTGHRIVLDTCGDGGFFGELSLLDGGPRTASAVATQDLVAIRLKRNDLDSLLRRHPGAALDMLTATGRRLRFTGELLRRTASRNANLALDETHSLVHRMADWIAEFAGSLAFLVLHLLFFAVWIGINLDWRVAWLPRMPVFDTYPFGFLNILVSLEAIILTAFVLVSQNRQAAKDRIRADIEYDVNLKSELEIAHLHEKLDRLTERVLGRLEAIERGARVAPR